jgi:dihydroneopterin aldolase
MSMVENMSSKRKWRINVKNMETRLRVGCTPEEHEPQRIFVNAVVEGEYDAVPQSIDQCINYDIIYARVVKEWPKLPHTVLLETRIRELLEHIFRMDDKVAYAKVSLCKPDVFAEAEAIGVEAEWTRADFERLVIHKKL